MTHGSNSSCTATANAGYTFSAFSGDCTGSTCALSNVTSAKSVTATFTQNSDTIGGTLSGLIGSVVLQNNGADDLSLTANGAFGFTNAVLSGGAYAVTIKSQPMGQTCTVSNGIGTANGNFSNVTVSWSTNPVTSTYSAGSPTTPGAVMSTTISGGALGCGFASAQYQTAASPPPGLSMPHGVLAFTTSACGAGSTVNISITYPETLPAGAKFYKFGPEPGDPTPHWFEPTGVSINGATVTYNVTDNGAGDSNPSDGIITDPAGYAVFNAVAANSIPTLSEWGMMLMSGLLMLLGMARLRRPQ